MDEFTRGIDVGAKAEILEVITNLADGGMAIVIVSSELEEVVEAADRVLVLARGRLVAKLDRHEASVERILRLAFMVGDEMVAT
jgi:ABC-type sugar transport system ATPase subunit